MTTNVGTLVIAPLFPFDTGDTYPTHQAKFGLGGWRTVASTAERDAIPAARREAGMVVVVDDGTTSVAYQLGRNLTTFGPVTFGGKVITSMVSDGTDGILVNYNDSTQDHFTHVFQTALNAAAASATAAQGSATSAAASATSAGTSATNAGTSATNAATSATNASNSATSAAGSANTAQTSANNAASSANAASTSAGAAGSAATNAQTSASNAAGSASAANTSAGSAATSASGAQNSANNAATSASQAGNSATAAAGSAGAAAGSATQASNSANAAQTSAANSANSATASQTSANNAAGSANNAATSASSAQTAATSAQSSASNAGASAASAATSATNAAASATNSANSESAANSDAAAALAAELAAQAAAASIVLPNAASQGLTSSFNVPGDGAWHTLPIDTTVFIDTAEWSYDSTNHKLVPATSVQRRVLGYFAGTFATSPGGTTRGFRIAMRSPDTLTVLLPLTSQAGPAASSPVTLGLSNNFIQSAGYTFELQAMHDFTVANVPQNIAVTGAVLSVELDRGRKGDTGTGGLTSISQISSSYIYTAGVSETRPPGNLPAGFTGITSASQVLIYRDGSLQDPALYSFFAGPAVGWGFPALAGDKFLYILQTGGQGTPGLPGPPGPSGAQAFTVTTAAFTQPAVGGNVTVPVGTSTWMVAGENVFAGGGGGTYQVVATPDTTHVQLQNLGQPENAIPGSNIASGSGVGASGVRGSTGAGGAAGANGYLSGTLLTFTASSTFLVPVGVTKLKVKVKGAGGDGGNGTTSSGGASGGEGGYAEGIISVTPGETISYTIAASSAGGNTVFATAGRQLTAGAAANASTTTPGLGGVASIGGSVQGFTVQGSDGVNPPGLAGATGVGPGAGRGGFGTTVARAAAAPGGSGGGGFSGVTPGTGGAGFRGEIRVEY